MRKPTDSAMGIAARVRWPRPAVSMYCAQSGIRDVVDLLGKVPNKLSVDRLEGWVWDQVYTPKAIPVLSMALCMVIDVVFPVDGKRCHQNCWAGALIANFLAALGVTMLRVAFQSAHPPRWACRVLRMLPPKWLQKVSDPSCLLVTRIRDVCSVKFPAGGFWLIQCLLISWTLWCVCWQRQGWSGGECVAWPHKRWNTCVHCCTQKCS